MDASAVSALSAVLGSLVGGSATVATAWVTQKTLTRRELNVRDMRLIDNLDDAIRRISNQKRGPITLISGQMGIVAYHLALAGWTDVLLV